MMFLSMSAVRFLSVSVLPLLVQVRTWWSLTNAERTAVKSLTVIMPRSVPSHSVRAVAATLP
jgi:hypothetical protein